MLLLAMSRAYQYIVNTLTITCYISTLVQFVTQLHWVALTIQTSGQFEVKDSPWGCRIRCSLQTLIEDYILSRELRYYVYVVYFCIIWNLFYLFLINTERYMRHLVSRYLTHNTSDTLLCLWWGKLSRSLEKRRWRWSIQAGLQWFRFHWRWRML